MARISTYPIISTPTLNDLLIGTDVDNLNETKNFTISEIGSLIGQDYVPYVGATGNVNLGVYNIEASSFIVPGGLASQFVKADGSLDSTAYVPETRTITINGTTYNLSANRTWDLPTIDSLTTIGTSGEATYIGKVLNIPIYQPQGNYITQLSGEATALGPGNATVTLDNTAVISKVLSGLNITGGNVIASDSILTAFGKVQNQINSLVGGVQYQGTWNADTNTPFLQSSVGVKGYYYVVSVPGNTDLNGITDWKLGDWAIYNGTAWDKVDNTDAVVSVNGYTGAVVLTFSDVGAPPATRTLTINGVGYDLSADRSWTVGDVRTDGSYANPSWITSFGWNKITGTPTTLAGYGITDGALNTTTLTINGTAYDLTANRTWNVGTVTSIGTSGPITGGTITNSGTIGITQAGPTTDGYLSSADWNDFNDKLDALSAAAPITLVAGVIGITQSGAASNGYLSSTDWNTFNNKQDALINPVTGTGTIYTLPMWSGATTLTDSPLSYVADVFTFQYNSNSGGTVNFTNSGLTAYTYSIQMNNFGSPRSTIHSYTDGIIVQSIGGTQVSRMFANGNMILGNGFVDNGYKLEIEGDLFIGTIANATFDTDKFLVSDAGVIKYRTGSQIVTDLGAVPSTRTLTINGTAFDLSADRSWSVGTVTSVDMSVPSGFAIAGNPVTGAGTLALSFAAGYSLPSNATQATWTTAYNDSIVSASVTGTATKTLTLNQQDGGTVTASWTDIDTAPVTSVFGRIGDILAQSGDYTTTLVTEGTNLYFTDSRARQSISLTTIGTNGPATYSNVTGVFNIPNYTTDLSGYVTLATDQTITGLKTILRGGDVLNFKIGTDTLYGLKVAYNQNELVGAGEATWSFVNTFNRNGTGYETTPISFFRGVLVTGQRLLSASINTNLLDYYSSNPTLRYPIYAYNTGVQQFASSIIVGETTGVVNAVTGAIADLPAGVVANFKGRVIGSNAVNNNEFVTLGQVTSTSRAAISLTTTGTSGPATYSSVTGVLNIPEYQDGISGTGTTNELAYFTGSTVIASLSTATYPSLTELSYVKGVTSSIQTQLNGKQNALTNPVTGTGTTNYLPKFTGASTIGNSQIFDNGTNVGLNTITPLTVLDIATSANNALGIGNASDTISSGDLIGAISFISRDASVNSSGGVSNIRSYATATYNTGGVSADLRFYVSNSLSNASQDILFGTEAMRIFSDGNLFIGSSPSNNGARLQVSGTATFSSSVTATSFIRIGGTSSQFLKADGSVDSTSYGTGTVTSVGLSSATSGVTIGSTPVTTSGTITLAIATASGSQNGLLSSTDWTTFNNKQNALTNPVTGTGTTNYLPKFTGSTTIGDSQIFDNGTFVGIGTSTSFAGGPRLYVSKTTSSEEIFRVDGQGGAGCFIVTNTASGTATSVFNGNFGIGTINPQRILTIYDTNSATLYQTPTSGTTENSGFYVGQASDVSYVWNYNNFPLVLATNSVESVRLFETSQNVHIGPTPAADNGARLQVSGQISIIDNTNNSPLNWSSNYLPAGGTIGYLYSDGDNVGITNVFDFGTGYEGILLNTSSSSINFYTDGVSTPRLTIASTGAATFSSSVTASDAISNDFSASGTFAASFTNSNSTGYGLYVRGGSNVREAILIADNAGNQNIRLYGDGTATFSGNVFISKASPLLVLNDTSGSAAQIGSFGGNLNLIDNATGTKGMVISLSTGAATFTTNSNSTINNTFQNTDTTNSDTRNYFNIVAGTNRISLFSLHSDNNYINTAYGDLYFQMNASTSTTNSMIIKSSGHVLIGNPPAFNNGETLQVSGTATVSGNVGIGGGTPSIFTPYSVATFGSLSTTSNGITIASTTTGNGLLEFADGSGGGSASYRGYIQYAHTSDSLIFGTSGSNRLIIDSVGEATFSSSVNLTSIFPVLTVQGTASGIHTGSRWSVSANQDGTGRTIIATAGQGRAMYFENNGDIVIPNNSLQVGSNVFLTGGANQYLKIQSSTGNYSYLYLKSGLNDGYLLQNFNGSTGNGVSAGAMYFYMSNSQQFEFNWGGVSKIQFTSAGAATFSSSVIIGNATNVGDSNLQVSNTGTTYASFNTTNANGAALVFARNGITFGAIGNSGVMGTLIIDDLELRSASSRSIHLLADQGRITIKSTGNVGINTATPSASALLDVQSTTKGFLPPRMTTTQKNAIASPAVGLVIYDTTLNKLCVRVAAAWQTVTSV